jgi:hypothetical protein
LRLPLLQIHLLLLLLLFQTPTQLPKVLSLLHLQVLLPAAGPSAESQTRSNP